MGHGGYNGGSTVIGPGSTRWFSQPKSKAESLRDGLQAEREREKILADRRAKSKTKHRKTKANTNKLTAEERARERELRENSKAAMASLVVEVRRGGKLISRKVGAGSEEGK